MIVLTLLTAYGITFGLMNDKARVLTDRLRALQFRVETDGEETTTFFQRMLVCPYCTGFHAGWLAWLLVQGPSHMSKVWSVANLFDALAEVVSIAFAASAACYLLDTAAQWAEDVSAAAARHQDE